MLFFGNCCNFSTFFALRRFWLSLVGRRRRHRFRRRLVGLLCQSDSRPHRTHGVHHAAAQTESGGDAGHAEVASAARRDPAFVTFNYNRG